MASSTGMISAARAELVGALEKGKGAACGFSAGGVVSRGNGQR